MVKPPNLKYFQSMASLAHAANIYAHRKSFSFLYLSLSLLLTQRNNNIRALWEHGTNSVQYKCIHTHTQVHIPSFWSHQRNRKMAEKSALKWNFNRNEWFNRLFISFIVHHPFGFIKYNIFGDVINNISSSSSLSSTSLSLWFALFQLHAPSIALLSEYVPTNEMMMKMRNVYGYENENGISLQCCYHLESFCESLPTVQSIWWLVLWTIKIHIRIVCCSKSSWMQEKQPIFFL